MLNLNDLFYFVQIVEHGGLAPAGRALGIPKSTLSKRLLEARAGHRHPSHPADLAELRGDGDRPGSLSACSRHDDRGGSGRERDQRTPRRTERDSAHHRRHPDRPEHAGADLLPRLAHAYPKVRIVLHATDRFVDIVQEGFDIALRAHRLPLPDLGLVQRRIGFEPNWLVASPTYLARAGAPARPADIDALEGIVISPSEAIWALEDGNGAKVTVSPSPRYFADEFRRAAHGRHGRAGYRMSPKPAL